MKRKGNSLIALKSMQIRKKDTVVTAHINNFSPNHEFDWNNTVILDRETNWRKRVISEMLHISRNKNSINKKEDVLKLHHVYKSLVSSTFPS